MLKKRKFLIGGVIIFLAIGYLGYSGFIASATYYYTVSEFAQPENRVVNENIRISGEVAPGSIEKERAGLIIRFTIEEGGHSLPVFYEGVVPDTFKEGAEVVIEGYLDSENVFQAHTVLVKCPSKYEPEEEI